MERATLLSVIPLLAIGLVAPKTAHAEAVVELPANADQPFEPDVEEDHTANDGAPWWISFDDPALSRLIEVALQENLDIVVSHSRVDAAEARVDQSRAPLLPSLTADGSWNASPADAQGFSFGGMPEMPTTGGEETQEDDFEVIHSGSLMLNLRYEVDIFGRRALAYRASRRSLDAAEDDLDTTASAVAARVGDAYFDALAASEQLAIIEAQIETQESLLELIEARYRQNDAAASDVLQQRQQLASARANLPLALASQRRARQQLALLIGRSSARAVDELLPAEATLPELPARPSTGTPAELLERRPELRAAQERVSAARAQRRSAERAFFPTLGVYGQAGGQLYAADEANTISTWGFGVDLSVPLFRGLSDVGQRREALASEREARDTLRQGLLQAASDVEGAIESERETSAQLDANQAMFESARQAYDVARRSYAAGVGSYLSVMTALASYQQAELTLLQTRRSLIGARLDLYEALGGRWTDGLGGSREGGLQ